MNYNKLIDYELMCYRCGRISDIEDLICEHCGALRDEEINYTMT